MEEFWGRAMYDHNNAMDTVPVLSAQATLPVTPLMDLRPKQADPEPAHTPASESPSLLQRIATIVGPYRDRQRKAMRGFIADELYISYHECDRWPPISRLQLHAARRDRDGELALSDVLVKVLSCGRPLLRLRGPVRRSLQTLELADRVLRRRHIRRFW
jgi:hypothetical protein